MNSGLDVVVVGAGVAGIAAGTRLAEAGVRVTLLEAAPLPGGRARSWIDPATGDRVDNGQHLLMGCYTHTLALLDRIGTRRRLVFQERLRIPFVDRAGEGGVIDCPPLPGRLGLVAGLAGFSLLTPGDRVALALAANDLATEAAGSVDEPVSVWLARARQSAEARRNFWGPLVVAALNEKPERASRKALSAVLRLGLLAGPDAARLGWASVGLGELYAEPAAVWIASHGGALRCSTPVQQIAPGKDRIAVQSRAGERIEADAVVVALPPQALARLLPGGCVGEATIEGASRAATSPILSVNVWFDRPIVEEPFVALLGTRMQWLFNRRAMLEASDAVEAPRGGAAGSGAGANAPSSAGAGQGGGEHVALVVSGAREEMEMTAESLIEIAVQELKSLFPAARRARLVHALAIKEREATVSPEPGWDAWRPPVTTEHPRVFLAGDWIATGLPATIESAARSGHEAAEAILDRFGLPEGASSVAAAARSARRHEVVE